MWFAIGLLGFFCFGGVFLSVWILIRLQRTERKLFALLQEGKAQIPAKEAPQAVWIELADRDKTRIAVHEIMYLRAEAGGVQLYTLNQVYFSWQSLKNCLEKLPAKGFVQVNRSTAVAVHGVLQKTTNGLLMLDNTEILVSPAFQKFVKQLNFD